MMNIFVCWFAKITGWPLFKLILRPKFYYENKSAKLRFLKGKAIIMPNHHSIWDFVTIMFTFPFRNIHCIVSEVVFQKNKHLTRLLKYLGAIKVDRFEADFAFVTKSCDILDNGGVVEIYPESRIPKPDEKTPLPFKPSTAYIALSSGADVIPVVTNGCYFSKKRLRIMIGSPININELYNEDLSEKENINIINKIFRDRIIELDEKLAKEHK